MTQSIKLDELPVREVFRALVTVVPDNEVAALSASSEDDLAPLTFVPRRPLDWRNYRLNLWRCITPKGVGKHARTLVPLFLAFVK